MGKDLTFLNDTFKLYYDKAIQARDQGNNPIAKKNFRLAAETLLKLAKESSGELKRSRAERASRLIEIADSLSDERVAPPTQSSNFSASQPQSGSTKSSSGAGKVNNQEDNTETKWQNAGIPNISFDDVAGLEDVKESIKLRLILPLKHADVYKKYNKQIGGGVLLYGPPGTGKTMIAKAIANEVKATFYSVKCSDIVSKWFGEAEKNIKNLFEKARSDGRAIIFFDEFESLAAKRGGNSTVMNRIVPELLAQIQGFNDSESQLLLLAATNRPWDIDSAMLRPGRFNELIYVSLPDAPAREFIIRDSFKEIPLAEDVSIAEIVEHTEGFNCADVKEFCDRMKDEPIKQSIANGGAMVSIKRSDVELAKQKVRSSVQKSDLDAIEKFQRGFDTDKK